MNGSFNVITVSADEVTVNQVEECGNGCTVDSGDAGENSKANTADSGYQIIPMAVFFSVFFVHCPNEAI